MTAVAARPRRHHLLGAGLIVYGLTGLIILVVVAAGILRGLDRIVELSVSVEQQRRSLTTALETASATISSTATTLSGIDASLGQAQMSVTEAATLATDVSATMANLAAALNVNILGSQPFASTSGGFTQAATELQTLAGALGQTSAALGSNGTDTRAVGQQLVRLQSAVDTVHDRLQTAPDTQVSGAEVGTLREVLGALLAWLAVQAVAAVLVGTWLLVRRIRRELTVEP
jgi:hypothetical protein